MVARKFEISAQQSERLDALARDLDVSSDTLAATAIEAMLDLDQWHRQEMAKGLAEADRGDFAGDTDLKSLIDKFTKRS